jgi:hypothetical protein
MEKIPNSLCTCRTQDTDAQIEETLAVLHVQHKGRMKNTLERFHIYTKYINKADN